MRENPAECDCFAVHGDTVKMVVDEMPPDDDVQALSRFFKVLGDPTRMRILWALDRSEMCVCDITVALNMTKSAVSHQLNTLRNARLVKYRRDGKNVYYSLHDQHVTEIVEQAMTHMKHK